jgi:amphi-Trp domain-containing protein
MSEETLFEFEDDVRRAAVAQYLRTIADRLESGESFSLTSGDQSVTLAPPELVEFEVEVEREMSKSDDVEIELELQIEWEEDAHGATELRID